MSECWNSVTIYGPSVEIKHFRSRCIVPPPGSEPQSINGGWDGYEAFIGFYGIVPTWDDRTSCSGVLQYVWNYRERAMKPGEWFFAFDTDNEFPEELFQELASIFPTLAFDCECIEDMDEFMGFGWYNAPPGGEAFRQGMRVPRGYWKTRFNMRGPVAQARHRSRVEALVEATRRAEGGEFSALPGEAG